VPFRTRFRCAAREITAGFAVGLAFAAFGCGTDDVPELPVIELPEVSWTGPVLEARHGELQSGETLDVMLRGRGLSAADAFAIGREVDRLHPVRSLRSGSPYALHVSEVEDPCAFEVWPSVNAGVRVERTGDEWFGEMVERSLEPYVQVLEGVIETSLSDAIVDAGGNAFLVLAVSDILQWDVDFFLDPRPGDRFSLLVETWVDGRDVVSYGDIVSVTYDGQIADAEAYRHRSDDGIQYFHGDGTSVRRTLLKSPLNFRRISSHFSHKRMHPILRRYRPHLGIDYAANMGTPVVALGDGTVTLAATKGGFGKTVILRHNGQLVTQYAHLSKYGKDVKKGARVKQGDVIGYVGSTGLSTGPHLDFRCQVNGKWINPLELERPVADPITASEKPAFGRLVAACIAIRGRADGSGFMSASDVDQAYPGFVAEREEAEASTAALEEGDGRAG
jgi:hypothetical protein